MIIRNKEEIKAMIKNCVYSEDGITYMSDKQYNNYIDTIIQLQQENQKYKEVIDEAIDKLYCWGEALDAEFQKQMLDILKEAE